MKCIKCKNTFYLNLKDNILICKNKRSNFSIKPQSIIWNCEVYKREFKNDAKINHNWFKEWENIISLKHDFEESIIILIL